MSADAEVIVDNQEHDSKDDLRSQLEAAVKEVSEKQINDEPEKEIKDVYAPFEFEIRNPQPATRNIRFVDAVSEGLKQSMDQYPELVIMGQDVAEYGGVFKITEGFVEKFGKERVRNTPLCER